MAIKKVWIISEECTACGSCVDEAPEVFEMDDVAVVINGVDWNRYEGVIRSAADLCPVDVIKFEED